MKRRKTPVKFILLSLLFMGIMLSSRPLLCQQGEAEIVIGKRITFPSKVLNTDLAISLYLPPNYDSSEEAYPVLYDLNAFASFTYDSGTVELLSRTLDIPNMILVGLPGLQNGYVPTPLEERSSDPQTADLSLKFFREELIPFIGKNYRTSDFNILSGHSVGGLFTMYTLFTQPDLFSAYIASSPWFQTNDQYWLKQIEKMFQAASLEKKYLFMTVGKKEFELTLSTYNELEKWMKSNDLKGLAWKSAWFENVDHSSMLGKSLYDGLLFIFEGWKIPADVILSGEISRIEEHAARMKAKFGSQITYTIPENQLNQIGYRLLGQKELDKAINIFTYNIKLHPNSPNTYDSLAEAYATAGDREKAIKYYKLAIEKNPGRTDNEKRILQNSKDKLKELEK